MARNGLRYLEFGNKLFNKLKCKNKKNVINENKKSYVEKKKKKIDF